MVRVLPSALGAVVGAGLGLALAWSSGIVEQRSPTPQRPAVSADGAAAARASCGISPRVELAAILRMELALSRDVHWPDAQTAAAEAELVQDAILDALGPDDDVLSIDCAMWPCVIVLRQLERTGVQDRLADAHGLRVLGIGLEEHQHDLGAGRLMASAVFREGEGDPAAAMQRVRTALLEHWDDVFDIEVNPSEVLRFRPPVDEPW